jgi:hypothetical protein
MVRAEIGWPLRALQPGRVANASMAHHLTHIWFQVNVTPRTAHESYLRSAFPNYGDLLWVEHSNGIDARDNLMAYWYSQLGESPTLRPTRSPPPPTRPSFRADRSHSTHFASSSVTPFLRDPPDLGLALPSRRRKRRRLRGPRRGSLGSAARCLGGWLASQPGGASAKGAWPSPQLSGSHRGASPAGFSRDVGGASGLASTVLPGRPR